jgi:L-fuconate dehydratase
VPVTIERLTTRDARYDLPDGAGSDSVHTAPRYSYAVSLLEAGPWTGTGLAFTLGGGNDLVCRAIEALGAPLVGREIEELMANFAAVSRELSNHHQLRWLGPQKGLIHLALASIVNACFDLWAKSRGVPLWKLLVELSPEQIVALLDLSYLEDALTADEARSMLQAERASRAEREEVIAAGYPSYDTSVGWFNYSDEQLRANVGKALDAGFRALKLKVGSDDQERDIRRAFLLRELAGGELPTMLDANQRWNLPQAIEICGRLAEMSPHWIEEPTHPDDIAGHRTLARAIDPVRLAIGEHVPNQVAFKNYLQLDAAHFIQVDCTRVAGISEFIAVSLLAKKYRRPVVPHVGDMGQIHQHLVLFNHIALGHEIALLEHIPHLREHFVHPATVRDGVYRTPMEAGSSSDLR